MRARITHSHVHIMGGSIHIHGPHNCNYITRPVSTSLSIRIIRLITQHGSHPFSTNSLSLQLQCGAYGLGSESMKVTLLMHNCTDRTNVNLQLLIAVCRITFVAANRSFIVQLLFDVARVTNK